MSLGTIRRAIVVAITVAALMVVSALPVAAHGGHTSCQGFGQFFADWARGGYAEFGLDNPGLGPFATSPGIIAETVELEHELFCE